MLQKLLRVNKPTLFAEALRVLELASRAGLANLLLAWVLRAGSSAAGPAECKPSALPKLISIPTYGGLVSIRRGIQSPWTGFKGRSCKPATRMGASCRQQHGWSGRMSAFPPENFDPNLASTNTKTNPRTQIQSCSCCSIIVDNHCGYTINVESQGTSPMESCIVQAPSMCAQIQHDMQT